MLRIGTRASALATAQAGHVVTALADLGVAAELVPMVSEGDVSRASLASLGGTGVFATRLREALLAGECDALVHSLKDLPTAPQPGLTIAAVPPRADHRDVLVGATLAGLRPGARVGTGSPRRRAQLLRARPDLEVVDIRGNVETRVARAVGPDADLDAVVLAAAGLDRIGRDFEAILDPLPWPTAPGQGALAVEVRAGDLAARDAVAPLEHPATRAAVTAERALLAGLEAGCAAPVAAHALVDGATLWLEGAAYAPDGTAMVTDRASGTLAEADELGRRLAVDLLAEGASAWGGRVIVLVPRGGAWGERVCGLVRAIGTGAGVAATPWVVPLIETAPVDPTDAADPDAAPLAAALTALAGGGYDWVVATSAAVAPVLAGRVPEGTRVLAIGAATARALAEAGVPVDRIPDRATGARLGAEAAAALPAGTRVLAARSALARDDAIAPMRAAGILVDAVTAYRTRPTALAAEDAARLMAGHADVALVTSGSIARSLAAVPVAETTKLFCLGERTAADTRAAGLRVAGTALDPTIVALVAAAVVGTEPA